MSSKFSALLVVTVSALALAACASTPGEVAEAPAPSSADVAALDQAAAEPLKDVSVYGLFLAGNAALANGRSEDAAAYLSELATADADNIQILKERAFTAAVYAGDIAKAAELAPGPEEGSENAQRLGRLVKAVNALATGDSAGAHAILAAGDIGPPHRSAASLLSPWAAAAAGDVEGSVALPGMRGDPLGGPFAQLGQALLFERAKRYPEAEQAFKSLLGQTTGITEFSLSYGEFLERRGKRREALAVYDEVLKANGEDPRVSIAKARAEGRKRPPPAPTIEQGAGRALMGMAENLIAQRQAQNGFVYLRLALSLDPDRNRAWVLVGDFLEQSGDRQGAREAYARVPAGSPEYFPARVRLALSHERAGESAEALAIAREVAQAQPRNVDAQVLLADLLRGSKDFAGSIKVLDGVIAAQGEKAEWQHYYARGIALERVGDWPGAERDLQKALSLSPNQPEILNYLGYTWADRGERLQEALAMLQRAVRSNPNSGAMIDSLGWAYYRLGQYDRALEQLERAISIEPGDPDVNNHLGDVYFRVGRLVEAKFQWERVLTLGPDEKLRAEIEQKLKSGLEPALAAAPPAQTQAR